MQIPRIKRTHLYVLCGLLLPLCLPAQQAGQPSAAVARSIPTGPDPRHVFVLDSAHLLSEETIRTLQDSAAALQQQTGADVAIVTLPTLHGGAIEDAALAIGRRWRVGSSGEPGDPTRDRGVVLLYVPDKTSVAGANLRVEVGRGLEGAITDGGGSRDIIEAMKPGLRAKRYDEGFRAGFVKTAELVRADNAAQPRTVGAAAVPASHDWHPGLVLTFLFVAGMLALTYVIQRVMNAEHTDLDLDRRIERGWMPFFTKHLGADASEAPSTSRLWRGRRTFGAGDSSSGDSDSGSGSGDSGSSSSGGDFGGGGGFSGGGSSDTV